MGRGDLFHGLHRSFIGAYLLVFHNAVDVFHYYDGIVYQQADREHHCEHGQGIYGVTAQIEHHYGG